MAVSTVSINSSYVLVVTVMPCFLEVVNCDIIMCGKGRRVQHSVTNRNEGIKIAKKCDIKKLLNDPQAHVD